MNLHNMAKKLRYGQRMETTSRVEKIMTIIEIIIFHKKPTSNQTCFLVALEALDQSYVITFI
jgi:hypothetical protein